MKPRPTTMAMAAGDGLTVDDHRSAKRSLEALNTDTQSHRMLTMNEGAPQPQMSSITCGCCSMGSQNCTTENHPSSTLRKRYRNQPPVLLMVMQLTAILSCLGVCHGFRAFAPRSPSMGRGHASIMEMPSSNKFIMPGSSTYSRVGQSLIATQTQMRRPKEDENIQGNTIISCGSSTSSCRSSTSSLFPQRKSSNRSMMSLMMAATDDSSEDPSKQVSDNENPLLVRVWLSLRKLVARLWALLLKPFRMLKSLLTKIDNDKKDDTSSADVTIEEEKEESLQEEVAITEVENIAAAEEEKEVEIESNVAVDEQTAVVVEQETEQVSEVASEPATGATSDDITETDTTTDTTPRRATSHTNVDLTGNWTLLVDDAFTTQYDEYLRKLGQPMLVRTVALTVIGSTKEETVQTDDGASLFIRGMNVRGSWERTLEASEQMIEEGELAEDGRPKHAVEGHELKSMTTADGEDVEVASWWESGGAVHRSWVVGGKKYGGGDFENKRYLTDNGNILVCESTFHPKEEGREDAKVTWRFLREGAIYGDAALQLPNPLDFLKKEEEKDINREDGIPESGVIVGDIMDNVASDAEANAFLPSSATIEDAASAEARYDIIEEAIERESWVPPVGDRWAIAAPNVDLTGKWKLIITEQFKLEYEEFLQSLGQPLIVRGAAVVLVGNTREETTQSEGGRSIYIKGINAKGIWERTLTSSGSDNDNDGSFDRIEVPIVTADSEKVVAESWWEAGGTKHVSWTYGVERYGGGSFESKRYLENDGDVYVCDSTFHRDEEGRDPSYLKWKFLREGTAYMLDEK